MSKQFAGLVEITDSAREPTVRITLAGDTGAVLFSGDRANSPSTMVTNSRVAIGTHPRKPSKPALRDTFRDPLIPGQGEPIPGGDDTLDTSGEPKAVLIIGDETFPGGLFIMDSHGRQALRLNGATASLKVGAQGNTGDVTIVDTKGEIRIRLNGTTGDVELTGADCAEEFDLEDKVAPVEPGTVMTIGDGGGLRPSGAAYDRRVAGIVSGAGKYRPGILLDKVRGRGGRLPLAMTGKAYCKVDATYAPVELGDLLTTSPTVGLAMKVTDPVKAFGAVIGKALQPLPSGQGLIAVLVALQ